MAGNAQAYSQMLTSAAQRVTSSYKEWTGFLTTAGQVYKYPFSEQLMIYAQRPNATACAEYDFWNYRMRRYVRRGAKGIALVDTSGNRPVLRYVFDVSDTGGEEHTRPRLWSYREEHKNAVSAALAQRYGISDGDDLSEQFEKISGQLAAEYWTDHQQDILRIVDGSFLEEYDEFNIGAQFRNAAAVSIAYTLMSRCGLEPENYFEHEDFLSIFDFNTPATVTELGTAVSIGSEAVLRQIEVTIKKYEREKSAERSAEHGDQSDLQPSGRLPDSQSGPAGTAGPGPGQIRENAPGISEGASSGPVQPLDTGGDPVQPPVGDRGHGQQPSGADDAAVGESSGGHGAVEGQRSDGMGGADEQLQGTGGGNYHVGADLQLSFIPPEIPSQQEQIEAIQEAESADAPSAFSIPQTEVDRALRGYGGKLKIFDLYHQNLPARSIAAAIRKEYGTSSGSFILSDGSHIFLDYRPNTGMEFWDKPTDKKFVVKWSAIEKRIRQMIAEGRYLSPAEMEKYQSGHLEQPPIQSITQEDIDAQLRFKKPLNKINLNIYTIYQRDLSAADTVEAVKSAFGRAASSYTFSDGTTGWASYEPDVGITLTHTRADQEIEKVTITWTDAEKRLRQLISEGRYLTPEELAQVQTQETPAGPAPIPFNTGFPADYNAVKEAHHGDIVLYQLGDFYEMFGPDARVASHELDLMLTQRNHPDLGRVAMCGIPAHKLGEYVHRLREKHDVTVSSVEQDGKRLIVSYPSVEHEAMNVVNTHETEIETPAPEQSAPTPAPEDVPSIPAPTPREATQEEIDAALQNWNGDMDSKQRVQQYMRDHAREKDTAVWLRTEYGGDLSAFPVQLSGVNQHDLPWPKVQRRIAQLVQKGQFLPQPDRAADIPTPGQEVQAPTVREIFAQYKPIVKNMVLTDAAYQNACKNSDWENAVIEGDAAVKRAALAITEPEFMRLYHDMFDFRYRLHREVIDETYPVLSQSQQEQTTVPTREDDEESPPWGTEVGSHSPWGKVQTSDQFADGVYEISTASHGGVMIRETDAQKLLSPETLAVGAVEYGWCYYEEDAAAPVVIRELLDKGIPATPPYVRCEFSETHIFKEKGIYSVREFDRLMKQADDEHTAGEAAAIKKYGTREKWHAANDPEFDRFIGCDKVSFCVVLPDGMRIWERQDVGDGYGGLLDYLSKSEKYRDIVPVLRQAAEQKVISSAADQPPHDPLAPAYQPGDTVYLDNTAFEIEAINIFDVQLRDPMLPIPLIRSESKENFERLLLRDTRNNLITQYLSTQMGDINDDFREVLTKHLLTDRDKDYIAMWIRSGENNRGIAQRLSLAFASRAETVTLETGEIADYSTSTISMSVEIQDKFGTKLALSWEAVAPILRTLWLQELDGFTHEPVQREPVELEGQLTYQVGDKVAFAYGDHDISGTIESIGELDILIHTGPYAWSNKTVSKDFFEDAVRHDERNANLFVPEPEKVNQPEPITETVAVYPAEPNHLPYEVVIQTLKIPERDQPEPEQTAQLPAAENFRITDDNLGVGGAKEKFRRNMEAINTLKEIELEGRSAAPAEQEILSRYVGWGGLADAFDPDKANWTNEFLELQDALTPKEYASARASTLNAHYTRPVIIKAIYEAIEKMGFQTGNILEPSCGIGNFFGLLPESMSASKLYGVELDSITGRIAQQLYPQANISIQGFEKSGFPDGFFDLAIGNVPFGGYKLADRRYDRENLLIHDYFFAKTIDKVRAGGVIAFITSNGVGGGTMDKKDRHAREYIARRCNLLGAVRLPSNASLANAGTEVGMDIVFLQKRDVPLTLTDPLPEWVDVDMLEQHSYVSGDGQKKHDHITMSRYFRDHPEMVLGTPTITSGPFGPQLECKPIPGADLAQQLQEAISHIHGEYREAALPELDIDVGETEAVFIPADPNVKNYSYTVVDGEVYYRENSVMVRPNLTTSARERVMGMVELRDCVRDLIDLQMDEYTPDSAIQEKQIELGKRYDAFSKKFGLINDRANRLAFSADSAYYLLCSLEVLDDKGKLERKADMFTKRTIKQHTRITSADTAMDALAVSIGERARVDLPFMAQLTGKTEDEIEAELSGVIYRDIKCAENPDLIPKAFVDLKRFPLVTADEYLSGNVRRKLHMAQALYSVMPVEQQEKIKGNVDALTAAQPKDLDATEIEVRLGATWIDKRYIQQFMYETLKTPTYLRKSIRVSYSSHTAEWSISCKGSVSENDITAYTAYGTGRANAYRILEDSLNLRDVRIYDTVQDPDGKERRVLNAKETTLAAQKQQMLRDTFKDWIWKDPQRRQALVRQYNEEMNCIRPREYDGSRIVFSGINPEIKLQPHQVNAVAHVLYGGNTLLAHEVGAGKTFEMIAAAMESKRLGLCHKSIFVVPNHLTEQTAAEFMRLYPSANILVTTKKDFEKHRRKKFCARIATGDYDAVIIGHSQFEKIPISMERQERLIQDQIFEITEGIQEVENSGGERFTVKQLERTKRNLEARLEKLQANHRKDDVVTFEQLGVDMMFVDESDNYKNLFLYTKMRNVAGLATTDAQKSSDMFAKCRYLDEITKGRGIVFATGTPISNSMTEMYTIQRYLQYDRLQEMNMGHFDCWASRFGETVTALELAPEGTGYRARTRFAKFFNLPELMNIFKEVADIKTADQLNLPTPEVEYHTVASKPTAIQKVLVKELSSRASKVHTGTVDPRLDNMLKITSDGRKLGLDQRIINPLLPDEPGTKVNCCVENILKCWRDGADQKLTQLVFCDISTPKAAPSKRALKGAGDKLDNPALHMLEGAIPLESEKPFTIYEDIRQKLIAGGMPPEQIAFIHEANTDIQKKELFAKVCSGQVRVLLGSTFKMGAGTNVQDRLIALHDLDCPWRPRDLTQRKGRIERRGNQNEKVHVYRYVTEGTFDAYLWQTVENKQKFISQIMTSKSPVRSCEDVDEAALSYAEIKALCAGDPRIKERMELDVEVSKLKIVKAAHQSKQFQLEDSLLKYFPEKIKENEGYIKGLEEDMKTLAAHPHPVVVKEKPTPTQAEQKDGENAGTVPDTPAAVAGEVSQGFAGMLIRGTAYKDREAAGTALLEVYEELADMEELTGTDPIEIGSYRGFTMLAKPGWFGNNLTLKGAMTHTAELGIDPRGNLIRIDHALEKMPERLEAVKVYLNNLFEQRDAAKAEAGKPFPQEDELREKSARLAELDSLLNIDGTPTQGEQAIAKSPRPSVLESLKRPAPAREKTDKPKPPHQER